MLMLGVQVLLGFQFQAALQPAFDRLPQATRWLIVVDLILLIGTMACLVAPAMHHQLVAHGHTTAGGLRTATVWATVALLPFAVALGLSFYAAAEQLWGRFAAMLAAASAFGVAMVFWYGLELVRRRHRRRHRRLESDDGGPMAGRSSVKDRIDHVLTEARTVLPGAQALLGFQFIGMLNAGFETLPDSSKYVHFASLACIALSTILLLTPAAYHRIVEEGEATEEFHRFASRTLLGAMVPLVVGVAGDVFVVVRKVTDGVGSAVVAALAIAALCYGLWFGLTLIRRHRRRPRSTLRRAV